MPYSIKNSQNKTTKSKGLNQFRWNPFHILRLPVATKPKEALWQGEKILSLAKLGLVEEATNYLSWLAPVEEIAVRQAIQKIEEPFQRLVEQLLWFDFDNDPMGKLLQEGLLEKDGSKLQQYLAVVEKDLSGIKVDKKQENNNNNTKENTAPLGEPIESDFLKKLNAEALGNLAQYINSANLALLLGYSYFHGTGPLIATNALKINSASKEPNELKWKKKGGDWQIVNPHRFLVEVKLQTERTKQWPKLLSDAIQRWSILLNHPHFERYVYQFIQNLEDDLLDESAVEVIKASIPIRLADMLVEELKELISQGQQEKVNILLKIISTSSLYKTHWQNAFASLRQYYQIELSELYDLIGGGEENEGQQILRYLQRLEIIKKRWQKIDKSEVLGLNQLVDESVLKAFDRISSFSYSGNKLEQVQILLKESAKVAVAQSTMSKINSYKNKINEYHEFTICHFCGLREGDHENPILIKGERKERDNTQFDYNIIYYNVYSKYYTVGRCSSCYKVHNLIKEQSPSIQSASIIALISSFLIAVFLNVLDFKLSAVSIVLIVVIISTILIMIMAMSEDIVTKGLNLPKIKHYSNLINSKGYKLMRKEGYVLKSTSYSKGGLKRLERMATHR